MPDPARLTNPVAVSDRHRVGTASPPAARLRRAELHAADACTRLALESVLASAGIDVSKPNQCGDYVVTDRSNAQGLCTVQIVGDDPIACQAAIEAAVAGRIGGIVSRSQPEQLRAILHAIEEGLVVLPTVVIDAAADAQALTHRQRQVLQLVRAGYTNREIAQRLLISVATVKRDVTAVLAATGCTNRLQVAVTSSGR